MFDVLSGARRRKTITPASLAVSVTAHLLVVGGLLHASGGKPALGDTPPPTAILHLWDPLPEPSGPSADPPSGTGEAGGPSASAESSELVPPAEVPSTLAPEAPGTVPVDPVPAGRGPVGKALGTPGPIRLAPPAPPRGGPRADFVPDESMVDARPELLRDGIERALARDYPAVLRQTRVTGRVVLELVVEADGRVRAESVRVLDASHPAFAEATVRAAGRLRFTPGRMGGVTVPVRVTLPIVWTLPPPGR